MIVAFLVGLALLVTGAEGLVRGASRLARAAGVSPIVVGLTVVAFGTSSPEVAISVQSTLAGRPDVAFGNVVGSNVFNVLAILGLSALVAALAVAGRLVRFEVPVVVAASVAVLAAGLDGRIGRLDGVVLLVGFVAYGTLVVRRARRESAAVRAEYAAEFGEDRLGPRGAAFAAALVVGGLALLVLGARLLLEAAVGLAAALGVDELVIGLTVVAAGTSLPEVATSLLAAWRGEREIAVGNVIGSNLFNLLFVLGAAAVVAEEGVSVAPAALRFDVPVMIAAAVACLPIFATGGRIDRWEGALFLSFYGAYVAYLVLDATGHAGLPAFSRVMWAFVLPLTGVTLAVMGWRAWRGRGVG